MSLDQSLTISDNELKMFETVDTAIERSVTSGNVEIAVELAKNIIRSGQVRGLALAKLYYNIKKHWHIFQAAGIDDNFEDYMYVSTGRSVQTITKYVKMWESIFENESLTDTMKNQLMGKEIGQLLSLTALVRETSDESVLQELVNAPDEQTLKDIIKRERGEQTSSSTAIRILCQVRTGANIAPGTLYLRGEDGKPEILGFLKLEQNDERAVKAINRILNSAHIVEVV